MALATICCCFHIRDPEEEEVSIRQNCNCLNCIIHTVLSKYRAAPLSSDAVSNDIQSNIVTSAPRILNFADADATNTSQKQDGQIREQENDQGDLEHDSKGNKSTELQCEGRSMAHFSESQLKFSSEKPEAEVACACKLSSEDEDVCPICLEEYIPENPKIVLECSHSYHLSCIYEWMERSENCPICGKMMIFDEAA